MVWMGVSHCSLSCAFTAIRWAHSRGVPGWRRKLFAQRLCSRPSPIFSEASHEDQSCPRTRRCQGHCRRRRSGGPGPQVGGQHRHRRRRRASALAAAPRWRRRDLGPDRARQGPHRGPGPARKPGLRGDDQWWPRLFPERARPAGHAGRWRAYPEGRPLHWRGGRQRREVDRGRADRACRHRGVWGALSEGVRGGVPRALRGMGRMRLTW